MPDIRPITCAGCALLCDDTTMRRAEEVARLVPECPLGAEWLAARASRAQSAPATVGGRPADVETALARAADLLRAAHRPALRGFDAATVEDMRAAVALADRLGAVIVTQEEASPWAGAPAMPLRGASTATLGEIRDRSQLVVIWREDPVATHPRLLERLGFAGGPDAPDPARTGAGRTLVVVDDRDTATAQHADVRVRWPRERDLEAINHLHARHRGLAVRQSDLAAELDGLLERIDAVPHIALVYGAGLTDGEGGQRRALALLELVRELCQARHAVTLELPGAAGTRSAQDVLAWQTGYAGNVDLVSGHPELLLERDVGVDLSLCVEGAPARPHAGVREIVLSSLPGAWAKEDPEVLIHTAAPGVEAGGTAHRLDGVPLTLQAPASGEAPTAATLLAWLLEEVRR